MTSIQPVVKLQSKPNQRRSRRISVPVAVVLRGADSAEAGFSVSARATNLNLHGAVVMASKKLELGQNISIRNPGGAEVAARVVCELRYHRGEHTYGVELISSAPILGFWGVQFPTPS